MTFDPNDDRLTAFALGEDTLTLGDKVLLGRLVQENPEAAAFVQELRELAGELKAGLAAEPAPPRTAKLVGAIEQALAVRAAKDPPRKTPWRAWLAAGVSLCVLVGFAALMLPQVQMAREASRKTESRQFAYAVKSAEPSHEAPRASDFAPQAASPKSEPKGFAGGFTQRPRTEEDVKEQSAKLRAGLNEADSMTEQYQKRYTQTSGDLGPVLVRPTSPVAPMAPMPAAGGMAGPTATMRGGPAGGLRDLAEVDALAAAQAAAPMAKEAFVPPPEPVAAEKRLRRRADAGANREAYGELKENDFILAQGQNALSTFSIDVDTASYSNVRRYLAHNTMPPAGAVRVEELVNYFPYADAPPQGDGPFAVGVEVAECPWAPKHRLARISLKAKPIDFRSRPASNLVFLIDVSGSMNGPERLPLVKASLKLLINELSENDKVALVVYAGASGLALDSTSCYRRTEIVEALERLEAGGSTNGGAGIQLAYDVAVRNFIPGGVNRVVLCTDGDWNVGATSNDALFSLITAKAKTGVFLSVLGFGMGNLNDQMMVGLANKGNGNYAIIDQLKEAKKVLVEQAGGTLITVAKDVKIQVEFNPALVAAYRLIGYEKRLLKAEDFHNDRKDAGEIGAGHVVTALYELVPPGADAAALVGGQVDPLKYQENPVKSDPRKAGLPVQQVRQELMTVKLRFKPPAGDASTLREIPVTDSAVSYTKASEDFRFSAAVASFGMLLRESPHRGNATYAAVKELAAAAMTKDPGGYRREFLGLVEKAQSLAAKP